MLGLTTYASAAPTTSVLGGGICINEIGPDPNGGLGGFDANVDGSFGVGGSSQEDEFIELYNMSGSAIDISGWELYDPNPGPTGLTNPWFTFPAATSVPAGGRVYVVLATLTGTLPANGFSPNAATPAGGMLNNGSGDNIVLRNPTANEFIHMVYAGSTNPPTILTVDGTNFPGFPVGQTQVGTTENWGAVPQPAGASWVRSPEGDTNIVFHNAIATSTASPGTATPLIPDDPNAQFPATVNFGIVEVSTTRTRTITVTNSVSSTQNLDITGFTPVSGNTGGYTIVTPMPVNGIAPGASTTIDIMVTAPGSANPTFDAIFDFVSNDDSSPDPITFTTVADVVTGVGDVATARSVGDQALIQITGTVTLSADPDSFGGATLGGVPHRIYPVQDGTGAILVLEPEGTPILGALLDAGSTVVGLKGEKERFTAGSPNVLEEIFISGFTSQAHGGPTLTPEVITVTDLNSSQDTYESELIQINNVSTAATGNWAPATDFTFTDGSNNFVARLESARSGVNGTALPVGNTNLVGIGDAFGAVSQLAPLSVGDLTAGSSAQDWNLFE